MKKLMLSCTVLFFIAISIQAQPGIKFDNTRHEFGTVPDASFPTWVFKFINNGNQDLVLTDVKASCGCTSPSWPREPIKPGDSGEIKVVFNANGYAGRTFAKSVTVTTNITENGQAKMEMLLIQGTVAPKVVEPPQYPAKFSEQKHDIGTLKPGKKASWTITLLNNGDSTLRIKTITSSCNCITFKKTDISIPPKSSAIIDATIKTKGMEPKTLEETIKVTTNLPESHTKAISEKGIQVTAVLTDTKKK